MRLYYIINLKIFTKNEKKNKIINKKDLLDLKQNCVWIIKYYYNQFINQ